MGQLQPTTCFRTQYGPFTYILSVTAFSLKWRSWTVMTDTIQKQSQEYLASNFLQKKTANPWSRILASHSLPCSSFSLGKILCIFRRYILNMQIHIFRDQDILLFLKNVLQLYSISLSLRKLWFLFRVTMCPPPSDQCWWSKPVLSNRLYTDGDGLYMHHPIVQPLSTYSDWAPEMWPVRLRN